MPDPVISIRGLRKSYGEVEAVRGVDLEVRRGEVFAFLGPNGAGKTTTVEILEGYRKRDGGEVNVLGEDPERAGREWRGRIGIVLQSCRLDPYLTVRESLALYAGYYRAPRPIEETIELIGLGNKADARASRLSGGQQRRLDVGMALIGDPELLFLDEPTTGFDPSARRESWRMIEGLKALGKTIFLTTHYMDEAQRLADRVAILREGRIVAQGTTGEIGGRLGRRTAIRFALGGGLRLEDVRSLLGATVEVADDHVLVESERPQEDLHRLLSLAAERGAQLHDLEVGRPSLEDIFLELTAEEAEERGESA
ncbi:MAG TPA: ABC transporter ATP-binding protein [Solirubrobacterales bacterium]